MTQTFSSGMEISSLKRSTESFKVVSACSELLVTVFQSHHESISASLNSLLIPIIACLKLPVNPNIPVFDRNAFSDFVEIHIKVQGSAIMPDFS